MSAVRRPFAFENFHIFVQGLSENTFNMYVDCSTGTKVENILRKRTTPIGILNAKGRECLGDMKKKPHSLGRGGGEG